MDVHLLNGRSGTITHPNRRRVDLPCEALDLTPPPHRLSLMLLQGPGPWTLLVHSPTGRLLEVGRWLATTGPDQVQESGGLDPHVLRAEFGTIPTSWQALLERESVRFLHLSAAGVVTLFLEPGEAAAGWAKLAEDSGADALACHIDTTSGAALTPRQFEAVSLAVSMGYYEVPHRVNQRELAERLEMSLSGLSRLLRRAEATIIRAHMDAAVGSQPDEARFDPVLSPDESRRARGVVVAPLTAAIR